MSIGCAVEFVDEEGEHKWVILEDSQKPDWERGEVPPEHFLATELLGKSPGEQFYLRRDPVQDQTATVVGIVSKYVHRLREILASWEKRFPEIFFVKKYKLPTNPDGSYDLKSITRAVDLREERACELNAFYRDNPISAATFAKISQVGILESLYHIASEGSLPVRCCRGSLEESGEADSVALNGLPLVIDPSALATLFFSGQYKLLSAIPVKCFVCEGSLAEYREFLTKLTSRPVGFLRKWQGQHVFFEDDAATRKREHERVSEFLTKLPSLVWVESGRRLADFDPATRQMWIDLFGQPTAEAMAHAVAGGLNLWTDDLPVADVSRSHLGTRRIWTQSVFQWLQSSGKVSSEVFADLTHFLVKWRYYFTRVTPESFIRACQQTAWNPKAEPLVTLIGWFSSPEIRDESILALCAQIVRIVWDRALLVHQREEPVRALLQAVLKRDDGRTLVSGLRDMIDQIL